MRKIISWLLLMVGAFLLAAAVVATVWAPGVAKKTPIDVDSVTNLSGTALVPTKSEDQLDVKAVSITQADSDASTDDIAVFVNTSCLVLAESPSNCGEEGTGEDADPNVISVSNNIFATDRVTAEAVNDDDVLPPEAEDHEGLVNKFPFDVEQADYPFWDGLVGEAVTATFEGTEDIDGFETYVFNYAVDEEPAVVIGDIDGLYTMDKTMWIDPRTGSIIDQEQEETRTDEEGTVLLDLSLSFTDEQVDENIDAAEDNIATLDLLTSTVPLIGFILGPILLLLGGFLLWRSGQTTRGHRAESSS